MQTKEKRARKSHRRLISLESGAIGESPYWRTVCIISGVWWMVIMHIVALWRKRATRFWELSII